MGRPVFGFEISLPTAAAKSTVSNAVLISLLYLTNPRFYASLSLMQTYTVLVECSWPDQPGNVVEEREYKVKAKDKTEALWAGEEKASKDHSFNLGQPEMVVGIKVL